MLLFFLVFCGALAGCAASSTSSSGSDAGSDDVLYQVSTLNALMQGVYDGEITFDQLTKEGDLGIGTFDGLDGEGIVLDGKVYQVRADGKAVQADGSGKTPFAVVTDFEADEQVQLSNINDLSQLQTELDKLLPNPNMFYAFKVEGTFKYVKTRSVPKQNKPYPPLAEVTKTQPTFEFHDVKGTLVGFWCPSFARDVNLPGYHLHFLTADREAGGHLLECSMEEGTVSVDTTTGFHMILPQNEHFAQVDLGHTQEEEIEKVEQ